MIKNRSRTHARGSSTPPVRPDPSPTLSLTRRPTRFARSSTPPTRSGIAVPSAFTTRMWLPGSAGLIWRKSAHYLSGLPPGPSEKVRVTYPSPQQAALEVDLESPGIVVLADVFYRGWELTIDGSPAPVYRVNGSMRGPLFHRAIIDSSTPSGLVVRIGGLVSLAGLVVLIVFCWALAPAPVDPLLAGNGPLDSDTRDMIL